MRYWYDTEFLEDGQTIELISIGIVAEDGREYYAVNDEVREGVLHEKIRGHAWLMDNVVPHLPLRAVDGITPAARFPGLNPPHFHLDRTSDLIRPRRTIASDVRDFLLAGAPVELWGYYSAYDHVILAQLWGRMIDLPDGIPMWTNDVQQFAAARGLDACLPEQVGTAHNALDDARWTKAAWEYLNAKPTYGGTGTDGGDRG